MNYDTCTASNANLFSVTCNTGFESRRLSVCLTDAGDDFDLCTRTQGIRESHCRANPFENSGGFL